MLRVSMVRTAVALGGWMVWSIVAAAAEGPAAEGPAAEGPAAEAAKPAAEQPKAAEADAAEIARLIGELDADQFDVRQQAVKRLAQIGREAIEALAKAAAGDSLEVTTRAVDVLKKLYQSEDEATQKAAEAALEKLAQGNHAPSAWRAKSVLKVKPSGEPKSEKPEENVQPGRIIFGGNIVPGIQIAPAGKAKSISVSKHDGVKEIKVQEDGDRYHITVDDKKGIKIEITKKNKEGKEETQTIEAKDAEELKKKNEEAYKLYKEYGEKDVPQAIQLQIGGVVPAPNIAPAVVRRAQIEMVPRLIKSMSQSIQRMADEESIKSAPQETVDELKKSLDELKGQIAEIEKMIKARDEKGAKSDSAAKPAAEKPEASTKPAAEKPEAESKPAAEAKPAAAQPVPAAGAAKLIVPAVEVEVQVLPAQ